VTIGFVGPLAFALGTFMPLGIATIVGVARGSEIYVAWCWAVNGFFSVMASVLAVILSMTVGFNTVLLIALLLYAVAVTVLSKIPHVHRTA
jgi:hypothetical protein